mmetsp:Transcript_118141/g.271081  ORF Transcript_118141/g.271081 Transcript_118141/m.271081 type:complete len:87 (-) Transcript_118141:125-385(-)
MLRDVVGQSSQVSGGKNFFGELKAAAKAAKRNGKVKKVVDTKASKGRKIRYVPIPKMVHYMAPQADPLLDEDAVDQVIRGLFKSTL